MERIAEHLNLNSGYRFHILYGPGIEDSYISPNLKEIDILQTLLKILKRAGFQRIVFISPSKPIYFLDDESKKSSSNYIWDRRDEVLTNGRIDELQNGPLGDRLIISTERPQAAQHNIGDVHGLRIVDAMFKESNPVKTCLIIHQAETFLHHFEDQRTLAGLLGDWQRLPSNNLNVCFFLFSAYNFQELVSMAESIAQPELKSLLQRKQLKENRSADDYVVRISGPEKKETMRLLQYTVRENVSQINENDVQHLVDWITAEDLPVKTWLARFSSVSNLTLQIAKTEGWFTSSKFDPRSVQEKLDDLVGLDAIKQRIIELAAFAEMKKNKSDQRSIDHLLHMVFTGNPGTGKTSVARIIGDIYHEIGILSRGHLVETKAADLVADHVGGTAIKTNELIDQAQGGVLFIDEAYALSEKERGGFGAEALETILTRMEDDRSKLIVILAGYPEQINHLLRSNPGLSRRFPVDNRFYFQDYTQEELALILFRILKNRNLSWDALFEQTIQEVIGRMVESHQEGFGNAGEIRNLADSLERNCLNRYYTAGKKMKPMLTVADLSSEYLSYLPTPIPDLETLMVELSELVGLKPVKKLIIRMVRRIQLDQIREADATLPSQARTSKHMIFLGNPGTGKTTVARLFGQIFQSLGILRKGHCVEVTASELIAGYVGQTASKTLDKIKDALDGVLFIDEAYSLARTVNQQAISYGQEVIDTLVKAMEDYRERLVVIVAGYPNEMDQFINSNPGLKSRFSEPIVFDDFTNEEVLLILDKFAAKDGFVLSDEVKSAFIERIEYLKALNQRSFGNARDVIKLYDKMIDRLSERVIENATRQKSGKYELPKDWNIFQINDILDEEDITIVIDAENKQTNRSNNLLKPWVLPRS